MTKAQKTVFLDRDGTLIEEVNFLSRVEDLKLFRFTFEAVEILKAGGFRLIVVTNQSGIDRGIYDEEAMHTIHREIQTQLNGAIDAFYFCPHLPEAGCNCRKPKPGMFEQAMKDHLVEMSESWMIGDKQLDIQAGRNLGLQSILVKTGYGEEDSKKLDIQPKAITVNLLDAVKFIVEKDRLS